MPINPTDWLTNYKAGASVKGDEWLKKYKARTDKLAKATSEDAQKLYETRMKDSKVLARRKTNLQKLTESDLNAAADAAGSTAYTSGVEAKAAKALKNVTPYLNEIDRLLPTLPAKTTDVLTNVTKRVGHIAVGLHALKERMG